MSKTAARQFLDGLRESVAQMLPPPDDLRRKISETVTSARAPGGAKHLRNAEYALLYEHVIPAIHAHLVSSGLSRTVAKQALLFEGHKNTEQLCSGSPARGDGHPFDKRLGSGSAAIMKRWKGGGPGKKLVQSCPDFAVRHPSNFSIVFEGKYFDRGGVQRAGNELVASAYEAFFYRALPALPATPTSPAWDYEFSCLLACDASPQASMKAAWDTLGEDFKARMWDSANIYVMILRNEA